MWGYVVRRTLQMIPTVLGVILITFVLFNVVGGSPAAMTLGRHVSPRMLEEFDELRGFNKPLIFGWWTGTRAWDAAAFRRGGMHWPGAAAADGGGQRMAPGEYELRTAFELLPETVYRWDISFMEGGGAEVEFFCRGDVVPAGRTSEWRRVDGEWRRVLWRGGRSAGRAKVTVRVGAEPAGVLAGLRVRKASVMIRDIRLARRMEHPWDSQFIFYLRQLFPLELVHGAGGGWRLAWKGVDFGVSYATNQRVSRMLRDGIIPSLTLTVPIFFIGLMSGISLALVCAYFRDTWIDRFFVVFSVALMSINYLVWIVAGQYLLGYRLGWFPVWGYESWRYLLLPVLVGVISGLGVDIRFYRTIMLDEMYKDYVRTALAKGVGGAGILFRHVLKNAMIPVVTNTVIAIPFLYTGSLLLESFFGIPGLGYIGVNAVNSSDVDVLRAVVFIGAVLYVVANLLTDICYALVDPRVKIR